MKNLLKVLGIIALAAIIGFTMTACKTDDDGGGDPGGPTFYEKLEFSNEQVYVDKGVGSFQPFTGTVTLTSNVGITPTLTGGKLTFSIQKPADQYLVTGVAGLLGGEFFDWFNNVTLNDTTVKFAILDISPTSDSSYDELRRENIEYSESYTSGSMLIEDVTFVYVDKDVTITGKGGKTETLPDETYTTRDLNISLKAGWNTVCYREEMSDSQTSMSITLSVSISNPSSLKWVINEH